MKYIKYSGENTPGLAEKEKAGEPQSIRITIQHTGYDENGHPLFILNNGETATNPVPPPDPASVTVAGYEDKTFPQNLRWYLEDYLNQPYGPSRKRAETVAAALETWGTTVFDALFDRDTYQKIPARQTCWHSLTARSPTRWETRVQSGFLRHSTC